MARDALAKIEPRPVGYLRSMWLRYRQAKWGWHVVAPIALGGAASGILNWALTMLGQDEYGAAMLLTGFFLLIGLSASLAIPKKVIKFLAMATVIVVTSFSGAVIWKKKGAKPWTTLSSHPLPPEKSLNDAVLSITDAVIPKETVLPFQPGKPIFVNLSIDNTGRYAAYNEHHYGRMGFVDVQVSEDEQNREIEELFRPIPEGVRVIRESKQGVDIPPSKRSPSYTTVYLASPSQQDLEDFNAKRKSLCVIIRVEYNDTKWTESCLVFHRAQVDNVIQGTQVMWSYCHVHNRSSPE